MVIVIVVVFGVVSLAVGRCSGFVRPIGRVVIVVVVHVVVVCRFVVVIGLFLYRSCCNCGMRMDWLLGVVNR